MGVEIFMMVPDYNFLLENDYISIESLDKISVLNTAIEVLTEGVDTHNVVSITSSYTHSLMFEILDNAKQFLMSLYQSVLASLNNYILNSALLMDKYSAAIIERYKKLDEPLMYKTYAYPKKIDREYPKQIKANDIASSIEELQDKTEPSQFGSAVDRFLESFGKQILDSSVNPNDLKNSTRQVVRYHLQGKEIEKRLTKDDLEDFIKEIKQYRDLKNDINRTKTMMLSDYEQLKRVCSSRMKRVTADRANIKAWDYPDKYELQVRDYERFADINIEMTRLLNGLITIYTESYNTKLSILQNKIDSNRAVIVELMSRTGLFASLNTKTPTQRKNVVFDSKIKF